MSDVVRNAKGQWLPGSVPNPKGRPKTGLALAERIRARVDVDQMIDHVLAIAMGKPLGNEVLGESSSGWAPVVDAKTRLAAWNFLADRGFMKPATSLEVSGSNAPQRMVDFGRLPAEDVALFEKLMEKAATGDE
jgi:hypothetical protein